MPNDARVRPAFTAAAGRAPSVARRRFASCSFARPPHRVSSRHDGKFNGSTSQCRASFATIITGDDRVDEQDRTRNNVVRHVRPLPGGNRELVRSLTVIPVAAIALANIIGTGVFVKARVMTCNVDSPGMVLAVWLVAGLLTLCGALVYAELGAMMPRPGGEFHFLSAAFGRRVAFVYGWTKTIALGASAAAVAILFVVFLNDLTGAALSPAAVKLLPLEIIAFSTGLNLRSTRSNGHATTALTALKIALVLFVAVGAFVLADGHWGNYSLAGAAGTCEGVPDSAKLGIRGFGAAMLGALWGYNGWATIALMGGRNQGSGANRAACTDRWHRDRDCALPIHQCGLFLCADAAGSGQCVEVVVGRL